MQHHGCSAGMLQHQFNGTLINCERSHNMTTRLNILLYVTTHLSEEHSRQLDADWNTTTSHPVLSHADILFFTPRINWERLLSRFPTATFHEPSPRNAYNYQLGAIEAMTNENSTKHFKKYDWVIRLNPDVKILDFYPIYKHMTDDYDALVGDCKGRIMTDFTVFRPRILELPPGVVSCRIPQPNAECEMTRILQNTQTSKRVKILYKTPNSICRIRWAGVVVHNHLETRQSPKPRHVANKKTSATGRRFHKL